MRRFIIFASIFGFLAVALGAFGAHGLKTIVTENQLAIWHTAVFYQISHALALLLLAILLNFLNKSLINWAGICFIIGILLFSGSLYLIVLLDVRNLGLITPIGGTFFLVGWLLLLLAAIKKQPAK